MQSLNPQINELHAAFCRATDRELQINPAFERWYRDSLQYGLTPEILQEVMASRMKREYSTFSMKLHSCSLRYAIGDEERLAQLLDEAAALQSTKRKRVFTPGKAQALQDTGRSGEPEAAPARHVSEVDWKSALDGMRKVI